MCRFQSPQRGSGDAYSACFSGTGMLAAWTSACCAYPLLTHFVRPKQLASRTHCTQPAPSCLQRCCWPVLRADGGLEPAQPAAGCRSRGNAGVLQGRRYILHQCVWLCDTSRAALALCFRCRRWEARLQGRGAVATHTPSAHSCAGTVATLLQKARLVARCRPFDPDIGAIVGEALAHHGLLHAPAAAAPAPGAAQAGAGSSARVAGAESPGSCASATC